MDSCIVQCCKQCAESNLAWFKEIDAVLAQIAIFREICVFVLFFGTKYSPVLLFTLFPSLTPATPAFRMYGHHVITNIITEIVIHKKGVMTSRICLLKHLITMLKEPSSQLWNNAMCHNFRCMAWCSLSWPSSWLLFWHFQLKTSTRALTISSGSPVSDLFSLQWLSSSSWLAALQFEKPTPSTFSCLPSCPFVKDGV